MAEPGGGDRARERSEFLRGEARRGGIASELLGFLRASGKWWLAPIIVGLMLVGLALVLGGTAAGPFIYAAF